MNTIRTLIPVVLAFIMVSLGCAKGLERNANPGMCRVVAYDAATHRWTVRLNVVSDGKPVAKRLTVVCSQYMWGKLAPVTGPDACHLVVGRLIDPPTPNVTEMPPGVLKITQGVGDNRVIQQFKILKSEILPDGVNQ